MTLLFAMLPIATGISLLYAALHWRRPSARVRGVLVLGLLNGTSIMTLHPWTDPNHWLWASTPAILLVAFAASRLHVALSKRVLPLRACVVVGQCGLLAVLSIPEIAALRDTNVTELQNSASGDVPMQPRAAAQTQQVIDFVNSHFLTGRRQAASLDYFYALDAEIWPEEREIDAILRHDPDYALVRSDFPYWRQAFPRLARFVDRNFEPHQMLGPVQVLRKRTAHGG
jgi:hypothetical protein